MHKYIYIYFYAYTHRHTARQDKAASAAVSKALDVGMLQKVLNLKVFIFKQTSMKHIHMARRHSEKTSRPGRLNKKKKTE